MNNVSFIEILNEVTNEIETHALIDHGDKQFTSMLKSTYDEMIAKQNEANTL